MSFKAKDLHFDNEQPAFLRRLRGELTSGDSARHEQPIARNKRMNKNDEDDAPTYVLEDSNQSLTKEEYDAFVSGKNPGDEQTTMADDASKDAPKDTELKQKDRIAEVGSGSKKRKAAKVIANEQEESKESTTSETKVIKKPKKAKAVKLTFGDEE
ncbi:hypothetical protein GQ44DRAFT_347681 [Phaeosphaeriaceae sp. PMI808]|nr:hypothetical protein GQ44DRAFT_347681 [Phaeosphaeriaceae sp. PMI808]